MLTSLRTTAILLGMCGLLSACGERLEPGSPPAPQANARAQGLAGATTSGSKLLKAGANGLPNRYIVVFDTAAKQSPRASAQEVLKASEVLTREHGGAVRRTYSNALRGFSVTMTEQQALSMSEDPRVRYVEQDRVITLDGTQSPLPSWGLDRVDQRFLPLDTSYSYEYTGAGVHAYIFDTGIRSTHVEFTGRMGPGYDAVGDGVGTEDCHGHGTHVAGTVGGATMGLAKNVTLHPVRVMTCDGSGTEEALLGGLDWIATHHIKPAVANMSLGSDAFQAFDDAVAAAIASGVTFVVSAGNEGIDACGKSPARLPEAITVGATDIDDARAYYSNYGTCVDIFAPGDEITSSWPDSDTATYTTSGTSMAAPHVAGAVALYLEGHPTATPAEVQEELISRSTRNVVGDAYIGSPNVLLHSACMGSNDSVKPDAVAITSPAAGTTLSNVVTLTATASDDVGISKVEFFLGGMMLAVDSTPPYEAVWDTNNVGNGTYTLTARAHDMGCNSRTTSVTVNVYNLGKAGYDAALGAPACVELASRCDTQDLLEGRGAMGPEVHAPNTLGGSCADGDEGWYEFDPSLERIKLVREDGTLFAAGKRVRVDVSVVAGFDASVERLDLYSAADAQAPVWNYIGTLSPLDVGFNELSTSFILPSGARQAVRGVYRVAGTANACGSGTMNDYDDVVFPVGQEADTTLPVATLTSPTAGTTLKNTVTLTATASDNFGVTYVEFYDGTTLLATDATEPYSYAWNTRTAPNGTRPLTVRAYDAAGNVGVSPGVSVTLDNDLTPPTVSFTAPASGATVSGTVTVTGTATDNVGVTKVEFYEGSTKLGTDTASPYSFSWGTTTGSNGSHTLTLKAYDAMGNIGTATRTVNVNNDTTAPTVTLTAPTEGDTLTGTVTFTATASDNTAVSRVAFFVGTAQVGTDSTAPYTYSYNTRTQANGAKVISAKAYDAAGNVGVSQTVNVTFDNDLTAPTTSITSPTAGTTLTGIAQIQAAASDDRGVITKVDFYVGSTLVGTDTTAPYSVNWDTTKYLVGNYTLKSRAWDAAGNSAYSTTVSVTVAR